MKTLTFLFTLLFHLGLAAETSLVKVATFDSGFGGYFTAKAIEAEARKLSLSHDVQFQITHYGDTRNAPYGEKSPNQIAEFTAKGVLKALEDGPREVFIACNTASTQYEAIKKILDAKKPGSGPRAISIIESSVRELKKQIDLRLKTKNEVSVGILATPATVKFGAYPCALAEAYGQDCPKPKLAEFPQKRWYTKKGKTITSATSYSGLNLPDGKKIAIHQIGPANWVDMIEHAAPRDLQARTVQSDLDLLAPKKTTFDVIGEFCTHFPVFEDMIKEHSLRRKLSTEKTNFIAQGPLMGEIFKNRMLERLKGRERKGPLPKAQEIEIIERTRPRIFLTGQNLEETKNLSLAVFPADPAPEVLHRDF